MLYDVAEACARAMIPGYVLPNSGLWSDGPYLVSGVSHEALRSALPLALKTSIESAKAAELTIGTDYRPDPSGKTPVPSVLGTLRTNALVSRLGIIAQFELWKGFAQSAGYPINAKQAQKFSFRKPDELQELIALVQRRNELVHEVKAANDPSMREFVEFTYACQYLAKCTAGG